MLKIFLDWLWPSYFTMRHFKWLLLVDLAGSLTIAAFPAINVMLIAYLGNNLNAGASIVMPLLLIVVFFGANSAITQIFYSFARCFADKIDSQATAEFVTKAAQANAHSYANQQYLNSLQQSYGACDNCYLSAQYQALNNIIAAAFSSLSLCLVLWDYSATVALLSILLPVPLLANSIVYGKIETKFWPSLNKSQRRAEYLLDQMVLDRQGFDLATMRASNMFAELTHQARQANYAIVKKMQQYGFLFSSITGLTSVVVYAVCLIILVNQVSLIQLLAGVFGLTAALGSLTSLGYQIGMLMECIPMNRSLRKFLSEQDQSVNRIATTGAHKLTVSKVTVSYATKVAVNLEQLTLEKGKLTALVGSNGSGKTSLIKALMGTQQQVTGTLTIDGKAFDLSKQQPLEYATVNQEYQKFDLSIREFLTMGNKLPVSDCQIWQALEKVELAEKIAQLPNQLDTETGVQWGGIELSGGQWQRLCIARGLLSNSGLLILDEPTSAIDAPTEERIFNHLVNESNQRLVLLTTHRVATLQAAAMIYVIDNGVIVEQGSFTELVNHNGYFKKLFQSQFLTDTQEITSLNKDTMPPVGGDANLQ